MADPRRTVEVDERERLFERVLGLSMHDRFIFYETLEKHLSGEADTELKARRIIRLRQEAIEHLTAAAAWLELEEKVAPTARGYMDAARHLGLPDQKVVSGAWGGWKEATNAYLGRWVHRRRVGERRRNRTTGRTSAVSLMDAIALWLAQDPRPGHITGRAYGRWAALHNDQVATLSEKVPTFSVVRAMTALHVPDLVEVLDGTATFDEVYQRRLQQVIADAGPMRLIFLRGVALIYRAHVDTCKTMVKQDDFPPWAAKIGLTRLWRIDDILAYKSGVYAPSRRPAPGWLQDRLLNTWQVAEIVGFSPKMVSSYQLAGKLVADGKAEGVYWWKRRVVDAFIEQRALERQQLEEAREERKKSLRVRLEEMLTRAGGRRLIPHTGIALIFETTIPQAYREMRKADFPSPVAKIGRSRVWSADEVQRYRDGEREPVRPPFWMQPELMDVAEVAVVLGLSSESVGDYQSNERLCPPPSGKAGVSWYWERVDVEKWLTENPEQSAPARAERLPWIVKRHQQLVDEAARDAEGP